MSKRQRKRLNYCSRPCANCPWRSDVEPGEFPVEKFAKLAASAYDMSGIIFACHKSEAGSDLVCAGFLMRGADHNFSIRMAYISNEIDYDSISDGGHPLYESYRAMAIANGVDPDDPRLAPCR